MENKIKLRIYKPLSPTLHQLVQRKEEQIEDKINDEFIKKRRIKTIEDELVQRTSKKEKQLRQKLTRSVFIKEKVLELKKEKCRMRQKYEQEKIKKHKTRERKRLNECWEKSKRYTSNFQSAEQISKPNLSSSKPKLKSIEDPLNKLSQSSVGINAKYQDRQVYKEKKNRILIYNKNKKDNVKQDQLQKFMEKLKGFNAQNAQRQKEKIQDMGVKLKKIDDSRRKKRSLEEEKRKNFHQFIFLQKQRKKQANKKNNKKRKQQNKTCESPILQLHSDHYHNWQEQNNKKQRELLDERLKKGNEYLEKMRRRSQEKRLSREIELESIEKKIYWERKMKNEQL